jgi:hypothetical protein
VSLRQIGRGQHPPLLELARQLLSVELLAVLAVRRPASAEPLPLFVAGQQPDAQQLPTVLGRAQAAVAALKR